MAKKSKSSGRRRAPAPAAEAAVKAKAKPSAKPPAKARSGPKAAAKAATKSRAKVKPKTASEAAARSPRARASSKIEADAVATLGALRAKLKAAQARIAKLEKFANVDVLLDILNRRGFERELLRAIAYVKRYGVSAALLYGDVDGLKPINDRFGHAAGDRYLAALSRALTDHVRQSDTLARLGGDEFGLLLWNISEADAQVKAAGLEEMVDALSVASGRHVLRAGLSLGMTMIGPLDQVADVIDRADRAMYARKAERKSQGDALTR